MIAINFRWVGYLKLFKINDLASHVGPEAVR